MKPQRTHAQQQAEIREKLGIEPSFQPASAGRVRGRDRVRQMATRLGLEVRSERSRQSRRPGPRISLEPPGSE